MKKKKAVYLRKSREVKGEDTFEVMRSRLLRMCEQNNWDYDLYEDVIGGDKEKEDLQRLLSNIDKYDAVVTDAVDRIGRDDQENAEVKKVLWFNDVQVITLNKTYDFENESDEMMFGLESLFAKWEHKQIKRRLKNGKIDRFRNGQYTTGKPALGYRINPTTKTLDIYEPEAEVIRFIFNLSAEGYGAKTISTKLNERGYRTQTGRSFPISHIRAIQKNRHFIGEATMKVKNKRGQIVETIVKEDAHPPIIDLATFLKANEELDRRNLNKNHTRAYVKSPLSGLLKCGDCNIRLRVAVNHDGNVMIRSCDKCGMNGIKASYIEEAALKDLHMHKDALREAVQKMEGISTDDLKKSLEFELKVFQDRLSELDKEEDRLTDLAIDGLISKEKLVQRKAKIEYETNQLKSKIKDMQLKLADLSNETNIDRIKRQIERIDELYFFDLQETNEFLKSIIDGISYWRRVPEGKNRKNPELLELYPPRIHITYRE